MNAALLHTMADGSRAELMAVGAPGQGWALVVLRSGAALKVLARYPLLTQPFVAGARLVPGAGTAPRLGTYDLLFPPGCDEQKNLSTSESQN